MLTYTPAILQMLELGMTSITVIVSVLLSCYIHCISAMSLLSAVDLAIYTMYENLQQCVDDDEHRVVPLPGVDAGLAVWTVEACSIWHRQNSLSVPSLVFP